MAEKEKEAAESAEAEAGKAKLEEKPVEGSLDEFLKDGAAPGDVEAALKAEEAKANIEAKKEVERMEKGLPPEEPKKPEVKSKEKAPEKLAKAEEDEPITPEFRAKYKVPDNIKTFKALAEWGPNAEANMKKSLAEKDRTSASLTKTEERLAKMEETLKALNDNKVKAGTMSEEDRAIEAERLRYLQENDPVKYAEELKESIRKEALTEQQKKQEDDIKVQNEIALKEIRGKQAQEWLEIVKEFEDKGEDEKKRFDNEVFPALKKIAEENPGMTSWKAAMKIYRYDVQEAEAKIKAEEEQKRKEKEADSPEVSHKTTDLPDGADKAVKAIENYDGMSIAELDKIAGVKH